jgi:hypothetical protein
MATFCKVTQAPPENKGFFECMSIKIAESNSILFVQNGKSNSTFKGLGSKHEDS